MGAATESVSFEKNADTHTRDAAGAPGAVSPAELAFDPFVEGLFHGSPADPPDSAARSLSAASLKAPILQRAQRLYGNRASQRIVQRARTLQRQCDCGATCPKCMEEEKQRAVQRKSAGDGSAAFDGIPSTQGEPLGVTTRRPLESHFQADLSDVRVHTGHDAARSATSLDALAYTSGRDIYFAAGMYAPASTDGQRLLAHEVAHVVQQSSEKEPTLAAKSAHGVKIGEPDDALEDEAERAAEAFTTGQGSVSRHAVSAVSGGLIQRDMAGHGPAMDPDQLVQLNRQWMSLGQFEPIARSLFTDFSTRTLDYGYVLKVFEKLPHDWEDNVASNFVEQIPDEQLDVISISPDGRALLNVLYRAMITGDVSGFEGLQSSRILKARMRSIRPEDFKGVANLEPEQLVAPSSPPRVFADFISIAHGLFINFSLRSLDYGYVLKVFMKLPSDWKANVAALFVEELSDPMLEMASAAPNGPAMLNVLADAIADGNISAFGKQQAARIDDSRKNQTTPAGSSQEHMNPGQLVDYYLRAMIGGEFTLIARRLFAGFVSSLDYGYFFEVFEKLPDEWEDNVAALFVEELSDPLLDVIADAYQGRAMLSVLYNAMITGDVSGFERHQATRVMDAKVRLMKPEDFIASTKNRPGGGPTQIFPVRFMRVTPGYDDAPLMAKLLSDGQVWANYPARVAGSPMFAAEFKTLRGFPQTLNPNEIVGIKDYEQGGQTTYLPALALIDYSNRAAHSTLGKIEQVSIAAATMGFGAPAAEAEAVGAEVAGAEAAGTWAARLALADKIANVVQVVSFFVAENRDWLIENLGWAGRLLVKASEIADSAAAIYGMGRLGHAGFKLAVDLRNASKACRQQAAKLSQLNPEDLAKLDKVEAETDTLVRELQGPGEVPVPDEQAAKVSGVTDADTSAGGLKSSETQGTSRTGEVQPANAQEARILDAGKGDATPSHQQIESELDIVERSEKRKIDGTEYVEEVKLPNEHTWRRTPDGRWCRFSNGRICVLGKGERLTSELVLEEVATNLDVDVANPSGAAYEAATGGYVENQLAAELFGSGEYEVTRTFGPLEQSRGLKSRTDLVRLNQQMEMRTGGITKRRPEYRAEVYGTDPATGLKTVEPTEVHAIEVTTVTDFAGTSEVGGKHKVDQFWHTVDNLQNRYPNSRIVYTIVAPGAPTAATRRFINETVNNMRVADRVTIVWRIVGRR